ncbi:MAG: HesA/MoeB/ThiF family protein [Opitutales bacterium]|nr:HesA/MoeB/ThiF family protein [Opitutales bacterium]
MEETPAEFARYQRQIALGGFGLEAQQNLKNSRAVLIGAGGVGSAIVGLLAGGGVGKIDIIDCDKVSVSNLHRQTIYKEAQAGESKARLAALYASGLNSSCQITPIADMVKDAASLAKILKGADACIDATDSFSTRLVISEACESLKLPLIYAGAQGFVSQVVLFGENFYLRDILPDKDAQGEKPRGLPIFPASAQLSGVLAAGIAIRFLAKIENFDFGKFLSFDFASGKFKQMRLR